MLLIFYHTWHSLGYREPTDHLLHMILSLVYSDTDTGVCRIFATKTPHCALLLVVTLSRCWDKTQDQYWWIYLSSVSVTSIFGAQRIWQNEFYASVAKILQSPVVFYALISIHWCHWPLSLSCITLLLAYSDVTDPSTLAIIHDSFLYSDAWSTYDTLWQFTYWHTVEPRYSKALNCGHLSITATWCLSQLHTHVYKLTPEI